MILKIAFRNVLRNKKRTFITIITLSVGLSFFIFFDSLFIGVDKMVVEELVKFKDSSIVIYSKEYDKKAYPLDKPIKNVEKILEVIKNIKEIESYTLRTQFLAEILYLGKSKYIVGTIIDPQSDKKVFNLDTTIKQGSYLNSYSVNEVVLGIDLAKELGVKIGDTITIIAQTKYDIKNALDFLVIGLLETPIPTINESTVIINQTSGEELLDLEGNSTSLHIKIKWNKSENIDFYSKKVSTVIKKLRNSLDENLQIYSFNDLYNDFIILMKQKRISSSIIIFFILLISSVGIVNTILMAIYERIKEIGILMSLGFTSKEIKKIFLLEGGFIGLIGSLIGIFLGFLSNLWLTNVGLNLKLLYGESATAVKTSQLGMPVWGTIYGVWNLYSFLFCFCFGILLSVISCYFPARYASKLQITSCLKFV